MAIFNYKEENSQERLESMKQLPKYSGDKGKAVEQELDSKKIINK